MISIVITVFNGEKYLKRCLDCMLAQINTDYELVLVNDGSTDGTLDIANSYNGLLPSFQIISYSPNRGVASARNVGLAAANGEYVTFVDCDDYIDPDAVDKMYSAIADAPEAVVFGYYLNKSTISKSGTVLQWTKTEVLQHILNDSQTRGYLWNKLFSVKIIRNNKITFHKSLRFGEDFNFCVRYFLCCQKVKCCDDAYYHYYYNPDSLSHVSSFSHAKVTFAKGISECIELMAANHISDSLIHQYKSFYTNVVLSLIANGRQSCELTYEEHQYLHRCLFRYKLKDIVSAKLKLSLATCRFSETLFYYIWRIAK